DGCGSTTATINTSGKHIVLPTTGCDFVTPERNRVTITSGGPVTTDVWTIPARAGVAAQTWSDHVISPQCSNRTDYNGGANPNFNVDCRYNSTLTTFPGHYFSWCAVMKYMAILCPGDWRVPTVEDFQNLHTLMGGTFRDPSTAVNDQSYTDGSNTNNTASTHNPRGGTWGGSRFTALATDLTGPYSVYWSSSEGSPWLAFFLLYNISGAWPQGNNSYKDSGFALRCVRDVP
ncbi:MAG: fibrobacter succinogenes major paralogous domain-containing protein, partial [Bacteroidales bacterium]|nr:fibrobacter succinogenes major paralogous domain-containing protein [Bacteroidales bacterium]